MGSIIISQEIKTQKDWFDLKCGNNPYETNKSTDRIFTRVAIQLYASQKDIEEMNGFINFLS